MASIGGALEYVDFPSYAALLPTTKEEDSTSRPTPPAPTRRFSLDALSSTLGPLSPSLSSSDRHGDASPTRDRSGSGPNPPNTPASQSTGSSYSLANLLISSTMNIPASQAGSSPRGPTNALLSSRDPLSIPITTSNFRRFVSRVGFVFWVQDRVEEVVMWRRGQGYTCAWIAGYCALCYKPWLLLLLPNVSLMAIMLSSYQLPTKPIPSSDHTSIADPSISTAAQLPAAAGPAAEGSSAWLANIQGLQNLMGFYADVYDSTAPLTPLLTFASRSSTALFLFLLLSTLLIPLLPLRLVAFLAGVGLFGLTHPVVRHVLFSEDGAVKRSRVGLYVREVVSQVVNDVWLEEERIVQMGALREVHIFQNERWAPPSSAQLSAAGGNAILAGFTQVGGNGGGILNLKPSDRGAWTMGSDGSVSVGESSERITVKLEPGWAFVETEDWEPDFLARWAPCGGDRDGWVYTNDAWLDPRPVPADEWTKGGSVSATWFAVRYCCAPGGVDRDGWVYTNDAWLDPRAMPHGEWRKTRTTRRRRMVEEDISQIFLLRHIRTWLGL